MWNIRRYKDEIKAWIYYHFQYHIHRKSQLNYVHFLRTLHSSIRTNYFSVITNFTRYNLFVLRKCLPIVTARIVVIPCNKNETRQAAGRLLTYEKNDVISTYFKHCQERVWKKLRQQRFENRNYFIGIYNNCFWLKQILEQPINKVYL